MHVYYLKLAKSKNGGHFVGHMTWFYMFNPSFWEVIFLSTPASSLFDAEQAHFLMKSKFIIWCRASSLFDAKQAHNFVIHPYYLWHDFISKQKKFMTWLPGLRFWWISLSPATQQPCPGCTGTDYGNFQNLLPPFLCLPILFVPPVISPSPNRYIMRLT